MEYCYDKTITFLLMMKSKQEKSPIFSPIRSMQSDLSNQESSDQQIPLPHKNPLSEAIFYKYQLYQSEKHSPIIKQEEDEDLTKSEIHRFKYTIKNLDTGEEEEIENDHQEMIVSRRLSEDRDDITNFQATWKDFWTNVYQNNEKLKIYCEEGLYDEAKTMMQAGQNNYPVQINWKGFDNWTPLHFACYEGHDDIVELLCSKGADINAITSFNRNGLHIAALRGHIKVVTALVYRNIEINAYDCDGNTALHFAAENGYRDIIIFLIENGCKIKKNREGLTPMEDCSQQYLKRVFYDYGFKENSQYEQNQRSQFTPNKIHKQVLSSEGITIKDFIIYRMIGRGSFGQVYLATKKGDQSNRLYAIKVMHKNKLGVNNLKRYALTERNVMSVIDHPFMVKLAFAFQSSTRLFLVMDYYPGGDLGQLIEIRKFLSQDQAKKYISQIVLSIEALHKNMIVFRDLKPANVVLDSEGHCRLTDFGLSKEGIYNNTTESFCGSIAYLAPQILSKQGHSRTVDWYLVGALLYEMLVGVPPYYNSKKQILFENIKKGPLRLPKVMSEDCKDLIKKLLSRDPRKRLGAKSDSQQIKQHPFFKQVNWQQVINRKLQMPLIQIPKIDLQQTMEPVFEQSQQQDKIQGWTFIQKQL